MPWFTLEDIDPDDYDSLSPRERALMLKRFAQKVVRMAQSGKLDPEQVMQARQMGHEVSMDLEGLGEDEADAFTPRQRMALKRLARNLRAYVRMLTHQHDHGPGTQLGRLRTGRKFDLLPGGAAAGKRPRDFDREQLRIGTRHEMEHTSDPAIAREIAMDHLAERPDYYRPTRKRRLTSVPIQGWEADEDDEEIGFLPALLPILSAAAPLVGGLLGGGGSKKAPAPAPAPAPAAAAPPVIMSGGGGNPDVNLPAIGGVVADQIRAVPPPIRQQVTDAVREIMDRQKAGQMDVAAMLKQITELLGPKLKSQLDSVNQAALQRQATYEHDSIQKREKRWEQNAEAQRRILARLDEMENKVGSAIVSNTKRRNAVARAFGVPPRYQG